MSNKELLKTIREMVKEAQMDTVKEVKEAMANFQEEIRKDVKDLSKEVKEMHRALESMDLTLSETKEKVDVLDKKIEQLESENKNKDKIINNLMDDINNVEQHQRNFSIRIRGLNVPKEASDDEKFLDHVYNKTIKPILDYAKTKGELNHVPETYNTVLEYGHVLPHKKTPNGSKEKTKEPPVIIVRFASRIYLKKVLHFSFPALNPKKAAQLGWNIPEGYAPPGNTDDVNLANVQINGDLTDKNAKLLSTLRTKAKTKEGGIHKAWRTANGKIKYSLDKENKNTKVVYSLSQKF